MEASRHEVLTSCATTITGLSWVCTSRFTTGASSNRAMSDTERKRATERNASFLFSGPESAERVPVFFPFR